MECLVTRELSPSLAGARVIEAAFVGLIKLRSVARSRSVGRMCHKLHDGPTPDYVTVSRGLLARMKK